MIPRPFRCRMAKVVFAPLIMLPFKLLLSYGIPCGFKPKRLFITLTSTGGGAPFWQCKVHPSKRLKLEGTGRPTPCLHTFVRLSLSTFLQTCVSRRPSLTHKGWLGDARVYGGWPSQIRLLSPNIKWSSFHWSINQLLYLVLNMTMFHMLVDYYYLGHLSTNEQT